MSEDTSSRNGFERHLQTGIAVVLTAIVGWVGVTITDLVKGQARMDERVASIQARIASMERKLDSIDMAGIGARIETLNRQYGEHEAQLQSVWPRMREMKERVQRLEGRAGITAPWKN